MGIERCFSESEDSILFLKDDSDSDDSLTDNDEVFDCDIVNNIDMFQACQQAQVENIAVAMSLSGSVISGSALLDAACWKHLSGESSYFANVRQTPPMIFRRRLLHVVRQCDWSTLVIY